MMMMITIIITITTTIICCFCCYQHEPLLASVEGFNTLGKVGVIGAEQFFLLDWF